MTYANSERQSLSVGRTVLVQVGPTAFISLPTIAGESQQNILKLIVATYPRVSKVIFNAALSLRCAAGTLHVVKVTGAAFLTAAVLCISLAASALAQAEAPQSPYEFTTSDLTTLFNTKQETLQLAQLSQVEMSKTEGAFVANAAGAFGGLVGYGFSSSVSTTCTPYGAVFAAGVGAINPIYGIWGFNSAVGVGIAQGVGSAYNLW